MGSEWTLKKVSDMADVVAGGTPSTKNADYYGGDIPWITPKDLSDHKFRYIKCGARSITQAGLEKSSARLLPKDTILFTSRAPIGYLAIAQQEVSTNQGFKNLVLKSGNDPEFFYYLLRNNVHLFESRASGTTFKEVSGQVVKNTELNVPGYSTQKKISRILSSFDNKIELNRKTNEALEQMAQALFKSWFVDFDPVIDNALEAGNTIPDELQDRAERRKQQLAKPDHQALPDDIRQLFPSEFQLTDELGWVPMRWETRELGNLIDVLETGRRPKGGVAKYKSGIPSVGAESIKGIGNFEYGKTKFVPHEFFEKMKSGKVQEYDVLLYKDGGKPGEFKPRIGMFGEGFPFKEYGINEHVFRLRSKKIGQFYLYYQLGSDRVFHDLAVRGGKAAIPGINQKEVKGQLFLVPSKELLEVFNKQVFSFVELMLKNSSSSLTLAKLRDILLPKLISGELRLPSDALSDAEQQPAAANS